MALSEVILVTVGLLALAMVVAGLSRRLPIPYTVLLVIVGLALREFSPHWTPIASLSTFQLTPELVFFVFLPALIFESGYNLDARQLLRDLAPILTLAVPALLISTAIVGVGVWLALDVPPLAALLFGALISATDPVAVIALFKELGAPLRLTVLVEGESLLNDATAIVVFGIVLGLATGAGTVDAGVLLSASLNFVYVFVGGALVGAVCGLVVSEIQHRLHSSTTAVLTFSIVLAYASFIVAEHVLHVSGVMAAVGAAVTLATLSIVRLPEETSRTLNETWELLAHVANSLLFLLVGLSIDKGALLGMLGSIAVAVILVIAARAASVYTMVPLTTRLFSLPQISTADRHIMWWGGLKGGLAIAIALSIPESLPERQLLLNLTLGVVIFTLLINAPTIRPLMAWLGLDRLTDEELAALTGMRSRARRAGEAVIDELHDAEIVSRAAGQRAQQYLSAALEDVGHQPPQDLVHRDRHLEALRAESHMLQRCYEVGLVRQYTYLDLRNMLRGDRERRDNEARESVDSASRPSVFVRLELVILGWLREKNWASGILASYQNVRLSQHLERNIAGLLMAQAALNTLRSNASNDDAGALAMERDYEKRASKRKQRVHSIARDFPVFFRRFEARMLDRVALQQAHDTLTKGLHRGEISAKGFLQMDRQIEKALNEIPSITDALPPPEPQVLFRAVPLLKDLSADSLRAVTERAQSLTFLPGDTVIQEGDRGHALYLIAHGTLQVTRKEKAVTEPLARLTDGDFFGEMALLGDQVRTATVVAETPCACWRLTRRDVLALGETMPGLLESLEAKRLARGAQ